MNEVQPSIEECMEMAVTKEVDANEVVGGAPAKVIGRR